jgi:hydrogenase maturation protease
MPTDRQAAFPSRRVLVAGLGNELLRDDGVGVHLARLARPRLVGAAADLLRDDGDDLPDEGVAVVEVGTAVLDALHLFAWADRVLAVDALQADGPPGAVYLCSAADVADGETQVSLHELGLLAALRLLPEAERPAVSVIGIEPAVIDYGLELTPAVQAALPAALHHVCRLVEEWRRC